MTRRLKPLSLLESGFVGLYCITCTQRWWTITLVIDTMINAGWKNARPQSALFCSTHSSTPNPPHDPHISHTVHHTLNKNTWRLLQGLMLLNSVGRLRTLCPPLQTQMHTINTIQRNRLQFSVKNLGRKTHTTSRGDAHVHRSLPFTA